MTSQCLPSGVTRLVGYRYAQLNLDQQGAHSVNKAMWLQFIYCMWYLFGCIHIDVYSLQGAGFASPVSISFSASEFMIVNYWVALLARVTSLAFPRL